MGAISAHSQAIGIPSPDQKLFRLALLFAVVSLVAKLTLAWTTHGTNDIDMWESSATLAQNFSAQNASAIRLYQQKVIVSHEGRPYYEEVFNHPPLMISLLRTLANVAESLEVPFPSLFRTLTSLADLGSFLLVAAMVKGRGGASWNLVAYAFCPAAILIAGFHGNSDPLMIFFLLVAAWSAQRGHPPWLLGLFTTAALNIKLLPLFLLPALFFYLRDWRGRFQCFGVIAVASLTLWLPYLAQDPAAVIKSTLGYDSLTGLWGIGYILRRTVLFEPYSHYAKYPILLLSAAVAWLMNRTQTRIPLFDQFGITLFLFLFLTPGFGVQYLYWLTPWAVTLGARSYWFHSLTAGAFLFTVYNFWSGGMPWGFANSLATGPWGRGTQVLLLSAWISVGVVLSDYWQRYRLSLDLDHFAARK